MKHSKKNRRGNRRIKRRGTKNKRMRGGDYKTNISDLPYKGAAFDDLPPRKVHDITELYNLKEDHGFKIMLDKRREPPIIYYVYDDTKHEGTKEQLMKHFRDILNKNAVENIKQRKHDEAMARESERKNHLERLMRDNRNISDMFDGYENM